MAYVYLLRCMGNTLYTGITTDITRRLREHVAGGSAGAKYTRAHKPIALAALWEVNDLQDAARIEYRIKHLPTSKKNQLTDNPQLLGSDTFPLPEHITCTSIDTAPYDI